jgi:hypothetical protein
METFLFYLQLLPLPKTIAQVDKKVWLPSIQPGCCERLHSVEEDPDQGGEED